LNEALRNADVRLSAIVQAQRLSLFGHIARMPDETDARNIITASLSENWRRPPGRPRTTWMKTIHQDLRSNNLSLDEVITVAQIRPLWRLMSAFGATHPYLCMPHKKKKKKKVFVCRSLTCTYQWHYRQLWCNSVLLGGVPYARACLRDLWCLVHLFVLASLQLPLSFTTHQLHAVVAQQSVFH